MLRSWNKLIQTRIIYRKTQLWEAEHQSYSQYPKYTQTLRSHLPIADTRTLVAVPLVIVLSPFLVNSMIQSQLLLKIHRCSHLQS